jgi:hypothetical protein
MSMRVVLVLSLLTITACGGHQPAPAAAPAPATTPDLAPVQTPARNPAQDREIARLRTQVQDRDDRIAELERRLAEAMNEAVRAMARLRTLATRAEAASAMAEAEVSVQQVRSRGSREVQEADRLLRSASTEFDAENYGGAVYLATQAKRLAASAAAAPPPRH